MCAKNHLLSVWVRGGAVAPPDLAALICVAAFGFWGNSSSIRLFLAARQRTVPYPRKAVIVAARGHNHLI